MPSAHAGGRRTVVDGIPSGRIALPEASRKFFWEAWRYEVLVFKKTLTCVGLSVRSSSKIGELFQQNRGTRYLSEGLKTFGPAFFRAPDPGLGGRRGQPHAFEGLRTAHVEPAW